MSDDVIRLILLAIAGITLPAGYLAVCVSLRRQRMWWFTYLAYFVLFGTLGGWVFAFAMSPSGLTATSITFLITIALVACTGSSLVLTFRKKKSRAEVIALIGGYFYPGLVAAYFATAQIFFQHSQ
jgi:hypothetical protein